MERVLAVPCLGYDLTNYFYDWYFDYMRERTSTTLVAQLDGPIRVGEKIYRWYLPIDIKPKKSLINQLFRTSEFAQVDVNAPVSGTLIHVPRWESIFSDNMLTAGLRSITYDLTKTDDIKQIAFFIKTENEDPVPAYPIYQNFFEMMKRISISRGKDDMIDEMTALEVDRLKNLVCPTMDITTFEMYRKNGNLP
jgi:hypothetical protein